MKNRNIDHKDDWQTPPDFYDKLDKEFRFDFDPCPLHNDIEEFDGLNCGWGLSNFVNPPYSLSLKTAFVRHAINETILGYHSVFLLPVSTSTRLFHQYIEFNRIQPIRFVEKRLRFIGINSKGQHVNYDQIQVVTKETIEYLDQKTNKLIEIPKYVKNSGMHESMIVVF